jgi:hypothetical protein
MKTNQFYRNGRTAALGDKCFGAYPDGTLFCGKIIDIRDTYIMVRTGESECKTPPANICMRWDDALAMPLAR